MENMKVRQSLGETLNNLENHEIQLALAMQDLMVAVSYTHLTLPTIYSV